MTDAVIEAHKPEREGQIASWLHLLLVLAMVSLGAYRGSANAAAWPSNVSLMENCPNR
jgi:hypothetical protein